MKKFNQYLLTHYPLLWNTRITWILLTNFVIHLLFFGAGFGSIVASELGKGSRSGVNADVFIFSILCGLLVLIVWLVFLLRNNAFKNFYRIDRWYLTKEFLLLLAIIFTSITYFQSYEYGFKVRVRSITNSSVYRHETDVVNQAMAFIPLDNNKPSYFVLNDCRHQEENGIINNIDEAADSTHTVDYDSVLTQKVRVALRAGPAAFSYNNYCLLFNPVSFLPIQSAREQHDIRNGWLNEGKTDSIRRVLTAFISICNKYGVGQSLNVNDLIAAIAATPTHTVTRTIPTDQFSMENGQTHENTYYLVQFDLNHVFSIIDDSLSHYTTDQELYSHLLTEAYFALAFTLLLLGYRRFSRKVFLFSVIGTIVWAIFIGLIISGAQEENPLYYLLAVLCVVFLIAGLATLRGNGFKTVSGILLSWHSYLAPYFIMLLQLVISHYYSNLNTPHNVIYIDLWLQQHYPFSYWVSSHQLTISFFNFFLVLIYFNLFYKNLTRRWQAKSEM